MVASRHPGMPRTPPAGPGRTSAARRGKAPGPKAGDTTAGEAAAGEAPAGPTVPRAAVFVDLDRTLLRGASGLVLGAAMRAEGLFDGRPRLPAESAIYRLYDLQGESLAFMAMVRAAPRFTSGWDAGSRPACRPAAAARVGRARGPLRPGRAGRAPGRRASPGAGHHVARRPGRPLRRAGRFRRRRRHPLRHAATDGYTGGIDGDFVWAMGKLAAVRRFAAAAGVDLGRSHAYSDSVFDVPLLRAVGHPHAVNPDRRLRAVATVHRWPVEHWDRPPGVPTVAGFEPYHVLRPFIRPEAFPYARFDIAGIDNIPVRGPALLAANHRSYFDVVALAIVAARLGRPVRFLAKREIFDAPVVGQIARALGGISVDRGSGSDQPLRDAQRALEAGELVVILPQGTIPRGEAFFDPVLRAKTGTARLAAMTGAPVVPIGLWGTERVWPRSARVPTVTTLTHPPKICVRVGAAGALGARPTP